MEKPSDSKTFEEIEDFYSSEAIISSKPVIKINAKVLVVGSIGVGKTSFANRMATNQFSDCYKATIGTDFLVANIVKDNYSINVQFWDIAGSMKPHEQANVFHRGASAVICVASVNEVESYHHTLLWKASLEDKLNNQDSKIPIFFIANKLDTITKNEDKMIIQGTVESFVRQNDFVYGIGMSVKTSDGLEEFSNVFAKTIIAEWKNKALGESQKKRDDIVIIGNGDVSLAEARRGRGCGC